MTFQELLFFPWTHNFFIFALMLSWPSLSQVFAQGLKEPIGAPEINEIQPIYPKFGAALVRKPLHVSSGKRDDILQELLLNILLCP